MPEIAPKDDPKHWFVHENNEVTKPGDTVLIGCVMGNHFGEEGFTQLLGKQATYLGMFNDNPAEFIDIYKQLLGERGSELGPDDEDAIARVPYFTADFEGVGSVTFHAYECIWGPLNPSYTN